MTWASYMPSPIVTASLQSATLASLSNFLAQLIQSYQSETKFVFNVLDFLRFVAVALIVAPPNYKWQQLLEWTFPGYTSPKNGLLPITETTYLLDKEPKKPRLNIRNTLTKWFIDCITMGVTMNTIAFLVLMGTLKGQTPPEIYDTIRMRTLTIILDGYKIWPIASIISFSLIPVERRIVFGSMVGLCWGIYMSLVAARV